MQRKLASFSEDGDDNRGQIEAILEDFQKRGWLSDERFAEQVANTRKNRFGSLKVAHELREKGISDHLVEQATAGLDDLESAKSVWQKKFGALPESREEWAKQARFLQGRGFGFDVIKQVLKRDPDSDL